MEENKVIVPQIEEFFSDNYSTSEIYNMILNTISDGILIVEVKDTLNALYINEQFYNVIRFSKNDIEISTSDITRTIFTEDNEIILKKAAKCKNTGDGFHHTIKGRRGLEETEWYHLRAIKIDFIKSKYPVFLARISNITNQKQLEHKLAVNHERHRIFEETTDSILFDYKVSRDIMQFSKNENGEIKKWEISKYKYTQNLVHPDDLEYFNEMLNAACKEVLKGEIEFRTYTFSAPDEYSWIKAYYSSIANEAGIITHILGRLKNIDEEIKARNDIIKKVETDPLTGIYNRLTLKRKINEIIETSESTMYFAIIDIDDFKNFNDVYGHMFGDKVLITVAQILKNLFPESVVGRFGGDEFIVFTNNITEAMLKEKIELLSKDAFCIKENQKINISFSIGIASSALKICYEKFFTEADKIMYDVKNNGKNNSIIREIIIGGDSDD